MRILIAAVILCSFIVGSARATTDCKGTYEERRVCERHAALEAVRRTNNMTDALNGAEECARLVIRTSVLLMGASLKIQPHEIPDLVQNHRRQTVERFNRALKKQAELLTEILKGLILHADEDEHKVVSVCVSSLK